jgi:tight adherence protein C
VRVLLYIFLGLGVFFNGKAYAACGDDFQKIDLSCVGKTQGKMKENKKVVSSSMINDVYFYKTENGFLGKFKVLSVINNKNECVLYLDAVTFNKDGSFNPTSSLNISKEFNSWTTDIASFELMGKSNDFKLVHAKGKCVFLTQNSRLVKYKKLVDEKLTEGKMTLYYAALILIGIAAFLISRTIFAEEEKFAASSKLDDTDAEESESRASVKNDILLKYTKPFFKRYFSPIVQNMKNKRRIKDKYKRSIAAAGLTKEITPEDFFAMKLFLIIGAPIIFLFLRFFLDADWPLSYVPIVSIVGFYWPNVWINGKIERRRKEITFGMPFVVDMLALSVEAGLDFMAAMTRVIEKAPKSALTDEFEIVIRDTRVGASRAEALRQLAWRVDTLEISSFTATLIAADSVGASIGPILKTLADEMRGKKSAEVEKKGAQAAGKLIIPAILLIIPAVFIIIIMPIAMQMLGN